MQQDIAKMHVILPRVVKGIRIASAMETVGTVVFQTVSWTLCTVTNVCHKLHARSTFQSQIFYKVLYKQVQVHKSNQEFY